MKVLVTGASGFTGLNLARQLYESGEHVRVLARDSSKIAVSKEFDPEIISGDIRDSIAVNQAMKGVEKVFHLAAVFRTAGISDQVYWDVHVKGTENLLKAAHANNVKRFVHCSTVGVHGHIEDPPADETYRFKPGDIYQETKLAGELSARQFSINTGLPVTVIRPCAIYGPGDMRLYKLFKLACRKIVPILGDGQVIYHMAYIDDLINGFILASENPKAVGEAFIIGGAEHMNLNDIVDMIASQQREKIPTKLHLSPKPFQMLGTACECVCIPLKLEPPIYRRRVDFFTKSRCFKIDKAHRMLDYTPQVSLEQGLARTGDWYRQQGLL